MIETQPRSRDTPKVNNTEVSAEKETKKGSTKQGEKTNEGMLKNENQAGKQRGGDKGAENRGGKTKKVPNEKRRVGGEGQ